jgi:non-ribosomal peptide synthetase-like protein
VAVRLFSLGMREGFHPVRSRTGWQVWATERLMDEARTYLYPLYASLITPTWLRALGARVGRGVEASTVLMLPAMATVGDQAFLADDTLVGSYELASGWLRIERAKVGKRAFLGNSGIAGPGRVVRKDSLVAVLSTAPRRAKARTSWLGSPPVELRRSAASGDQSRTFSPATSVKVQRALVELCRLFPVVVTAGLALGLALALVGGLERWGALVTLSLAGPMLLVVGVAAALVATAAKWLLVGRHRAIEHPLWSSFVWRNELADAFVELVAVPWFVRGELATPVFVLWLRSLGARIGRGVWCESYWLPEADLVRLGDGATVNRGCVLQTHLFHDRIMSMDTVTLHPGATLGPQSVILPAASLGEGSTVGPSSLVLRGDEVPAGSLWFGNPIAPWR